MDNLEKWLNMQDIKNYGIDIDNGKISPDDLGIELEDMDQDIQEELEEMELII